MENKTFYVRYLNHLPVPIDTAYGRGPQGTNSLQTVSHLVAAFQALPNSPIASVFAGEVSLHLPDGVDRSALSSECFASVDENDTTLETGCMLTAIWPHGSKSKHPLIIKSRIDSHQGVYQLFNAIKVPVISKTVSTHKI